MKKMILPLILFTCSVSAEKLTPGITEPFDVIKVTSEIQGTVKYYNKDIGQETSNSKILMKLDDKTIKLQRDLAKEELLQAKIEKEYYTKKLERFEDLLKQKNLSESDYDDVLFQLNTASNKINQKEIAYKQRENDLGNTTFYGKDGYVVSKRNIEVGQYVTSSTELYELIDIRKLKVSILVSEKELPHFNINQSVEVLADSKKIKGRIIYKGISMQEGTYAYPVVVEIENKDLNIPVSKNVLIDYGVK